jgi:hypothetical protein
LPLKTDRASLLWGTAIATAFVVGSVVVVFKFPNFRLRFNVKQVEALVVSALLSVVLISSYRKLWKRPGFWALLLAFLGVYWLAVMCVGDGVGGLQMDVLCGVAGGCGALNCAIAGIASS